MTSAAHRKWPRSSAAQIYTEHCWHDVTEPGSHPKQTHLLTFLFLLLLLFLPRDDVRASLKQSSGSAVTSEPVWTSRSRFGSKSPLSLSSSYPTKRLWIFLKQRISVAAEPSVHSSLLIWIFLSFPKWKYYYFLTETGIQKRRCSSQISANSQSLCA